MTDFIESDKTIAIGDLVLSNYHKGELIFKVTKIERRFLTKDDLRFDCYKGGQVGDEYNPYVTIESVANLSINVDPNKKFRKTVKGLDAAHLKKIDHKHIEAHIERIKNILADLLL